MSYYNLSQISKLLDIPKDTLRYYDKLGLLVCSREENNYRVYDENQVTKLKYIIAMKKAGFSLKAMEEIFNLTEGTPQCWANLKSIFNKQRSFLEKKRHELDLLISLVDEYTKELNEQNEETMLALIEEIIKEDKVEI
ncbi:MAG: MerR family transcriptional regulator [Clostridium sp.]